MLEKCKRTHERNNTNISSKGRKNKPQQATKSLKGLVIDKDWKIGADSLNMPLYRRQFNKKSGKEYWRAHSYYSTVTNALIGLVDQGIRDTKLTDLRIVCRKIDQLHQDIIQACKINGKQKR